MKRVFYYTFVFLGLFFLGFSSLLVAQQREKNDSFESFMDSITNRIEKLRTQLPGLKSGRSFSYYNCRRELEQSIFIKDFEQYVKNEELEKAKKLVLEKLEQVEFRRDEHSLLFYSKYEKRINNEIKFQRIRYQKLFANEKNFKKALKEYLKDGSLSSLELAKRKTLLAIKYASENNLVETNKYLASYLSYINTLIFDIQSPFDLKKITNNEKAFEKEFLPLISSDSLASLDSAKEMVEHCYTFSLNSNSILDTVFFSKKRLVVINAISDFYDKQNRKLALENMTDQATIARLDTLNPLGVFKWHDFIIVINEIVSSNSSHSLKKGDAIIKSDKKLINYIKDQDMIKFKNNYKLGGTSFIPYKNSGSFSEFLYNHDTKKWQYIICYKQVENSYFTKEISKYMPPLMFKEENQE